MRPVWDYEGPEGLLMKIEMCLCVCMEIQRLMETVARRVSIDDLESADSELGRKKMKHICSFKTTVKDRGKHKGGMSHYTVHIPIGGFIESVIKFVLFTSILFYEVYIFTLII